MALESVAQEFRAAAIDRIDPARDDQYRDAGRAGPAQREDGGLGVAAACPGVIHQQHMGAARRWRHRREVTRADVPRIA